MIIILMGVSGSGKTTIGEQLSEDLGIPFFDADDFHSKENINKMKNGIALNDEDRLPWLETLSLKIQEWQNSGGAILACSSLKESYRKILSSKEKSIFWVFLFGTFELIDRRLNHRNSHYMKSTLLQSQFNTLEIPNYGLHINIDADIDDIVREIIVKLKLI